MRYLFYTSESSWPLAEPPGLPAGYSFELWRPRITRVLPPQQGLLPFGVWWLMHQLRLFSNRCYAVALIRCGNEVVHRVMVTPAYLRFPFMRPQDLQLGDVWTSDPHRGKGLATAALTRLVHLLRQPEQTLWALIDESNGASIRIFEKSGFRLIGAGRRTRRLGLELLGSYVLDERLGDEQHGCKEDLNDG